MLYSCKKEEYEFPLIYTGEVTDISEEGAVFHAKITDISTDGTSQYGFVWDNRALPDLNSSRLVLSDDPGNGTFSARITNDLVADSLYYVRAFAKNSQFITYGQQVTFQSQGSMAPVILDFEPKQGSSVTQVTLTGDNFSADQDNNLVMFGQVIAIVDSSNKDKLVVTLPPEVQISGFVNISITTAGQTSQSSGTFRLEGVIITGIDPVMAVGGDVITLSGEDFGPDITDNMLTIGGVEAEILSLNDGSITALTPYNAPIGETDVALTFNGKTCTLSQGLIVRNPWLLLDSSPEYGFHRIDAAAYSIGGLGYYGLGYLPNFNENRNDFCCYHPQNNTWEQKASFPGAGRHDGVYFAFDGVAFAGLGTNDAEFYTDFYEYDLVLDAWTQKSGFPGATRFEAFSIGLGGKGYYGLGTEVGGGDDSELNDFWEYDPANDQWTKLADFPGSALKEVTGFILDGKIYVGLGMSTLMYPITREFWEYDPETGSWSRKGDFPGKARRQPLGFTIGNDAYIVSGLEVSEYGTLLSDAWRFDTSLNRWIRIADLPYSPFYQGAVFVIGDTGYLTTGETWGFYQNPGDFISFKPEGN